MLGALLGRGAHGAVYEAADRASGQRVAVKLFGDGTDPSRIRREIAALRLLRVRGVAQFIEEGLADGLVYVAMELVRGRDFPGAPAPRSWDELARTVIALFETLAEVHSAGIVHRDLKPANVLVDDEGVPKVVDFGVSWGANIAHARTREGQLLGTPAYLSPEQIRGEQAGIPTDLYAAGVMLYEALSGVVPHGGTSPGLLYRRAREPAQPLLEVAPHTPRNVARVVDRLLRTDPLDRPRSADLVVALLTHRDGAAEDALPRLGRQRPVDEVWRALERGRSAAVEGPRGSGRTTTLDGVLRRCAEHGREAVALVPGRLPYSSLAPVLPALELDGLGLADADAAVEQALLAVLRAGVLVLADDLERCDTRSQRLLTRASAHGGIVLARLPPAKRDGLHRGVLVPVELRDLDERELEPLFLGGDRVFHTRADAARILHRVTGGRAARVVGELTRWVRLGAARWQGRTLSVDPWLIDELEQRPSANVLELALSAHQSEVMEWLALCPRGVEVSVLIRAMRLRRFEVEGLLDELVACGAVERRGAHVVATGVAPELEPWSPSRIRAAHRALAEALAPGSPGRLAHLLGGDDVQAPVAPRDLAEEAVAVARRCINEGRLARASSALADAATALHRAADEAASERVLTEWVRVAVLMRVPVALDRVLAALAHAPSRPGTQALARFAHAALALLTGGPRPLEQLEAIGPLPDDALELERLQLLVLAARRAPPEVEHATVVRACRWAHAHGDDEARARASGWLGRLAQREGEHEEAARRHHSAARLTHNAVAAIEALLDAATSEMEALQLAAASRDAELALAAAAAARNPVQEAQAEWLLRALAYREDRATFVDEELLNVVARVGAAELEARVALTEAAIAFRLGATARARALALLATARWQELARAEPAALTRALAAACGAALEPHTLDELLALASATQPAVGLQILALLARAHPELSGRARLLAAPLARCLPASMQLARLEVLSAPEALDLMREPLAEPPPRHR